MKIDASRTVWLAVLALCLVQFVDVLGVTVVVTALPAMLAGLLDRAYQAGKHGNSHRNASKMLERGASLAVIATPGARPARP